MFYFSFLTALNIAAVKTKNSTPYMVQSPLPYAINALEPIMSEHQLDLHYNKHHASYVTNFNNLVD